MDLIISNYGTFIGMKSERIQIKEKGELVQEVPFFNIDQIVVISRGVSFSTDALEKCVENGIPISFVSYNGTPYAQLTSPYLQGTVITRREQMQAYYDQRGVYLGKQFAQGKLGNQISLLKYISKYRKDRNPRLYNLVLERVGEIDRVQGEIERVEGQNVDEVRQAILNIEGRGAAIYWEAVAEILPEEVEFEKREKRGTENPVNMAINYGYGILYSQIWSAITLAGLDPFAGFVHVDRPGKPSLVLDLIEEFRQPVVDRTIFGMLGKGSRFEVEDGQLTQEARRSIAGKVLERLEATENFKGKKYKLKTIIHRQARSIATYVRGEGKYRAFVGGW